MLTRVKNLFGNLAIYGLGDVSTQLVSLFLLPIFTKKLSTTDYGIIAMLAIIEQITKVAFRWGVDTAFIRLYYDCIDQSARQRLASTIFFFLLAANGSLLVLGVASADWLSTWLIGAHLGLLVGLTIANTFVTAFFFIPLQVLRISERPREFIAITFSRSMGTVVARLVLVIWAGWGVLGIVAADVIVTTLMALALVRWFAPLIRPVFSRPVIREALRFGLPRVPHSVAQQVIGSADKYFLRTFGTLSDAGLYNIGASFGLTLKLFLAAFESAWTPFFLALKNDADARRIYSTVSTYVVAVLVLLVAGLCALATDAVDLFTASKFHAASIVTPWIAMGAMFQGFYLVGSIGLVITKRTAFYPVATGIAAAVNVLANVILIPRFGMLGAAWANLAAYAALAAVTSGFSWYVYPIRYEWSRLLRIAAAGGASYVAARVVVPSTLPHALALAMRGAVTVPAYVLVLALTGFFHAGELRLLREIRQRGLQGRARRTERTHSAQVEVAEAMAAVDPDVTVASSGLEPAREGEPPATRGSRSRRR